MYEVTEAFLAEQYSSSIFAEPRDRFCRQWLEDHCGSEDLALMKATRAWFWGPGPVITETEYLVASLGRQPSRHEVVALIEESSRLMQPCFEAWCQSTEYKTLWRTYKEQLLRAHDEAQPGYASAWNELRDKLLRHGGTDVVPPGSPDALLGRLVDMGAVVPASTDSVVIRGEQPNGPTNAVMSWRRGEAVAIGTGYAMSDDSVWRQHSWAWDSDGRLIETTERPARYFGIRLDGPEAESFAQRIAPQTI